MAPTTRAAVVLVLVAFALLLGPPSAAAQCPAWQQTVIGPDVDQPTMVYDAARARVVAYTHRQTWDFDGDRWTQVAAGGPAPTSQYGHAMCYDRARGVTVLFGGGSPVHRLRETWEWDGAAWSLRSTTGPSPRFEPAMAFDEARAVCVLFGGLTPTGTAQTWEWNGATWTLRSSAGPTGRSGHAMAYDASRQVVVMNGGAGLDLDETWEWNGSAWTLRDADSLTPGPRVRASLAYDRASERVLLYGGTGDVATADEVWALTAKGWTLIDTLNARPSAGHSACFDEQTGRMLVLGGTWGGVPSITTYDDLVAWDGSNWRVVFEPIRVPRPGQAWNGPCGDFDSVRGRVVYFSTEGVWEYEAPGIVRPLEGQGFAVGSTVFDPTTGTFFTAVRLASGDIGVFDYNRTGWTLTGQFATGEESSWQSGVAFDADRAVRVVIVRNPSPKKWIYDTFQTWENNGPGWVKRADTSPRVDQLVYAPSAGGVLAYSTLQGAWLWDGSTWSATANNPPALIGRSLTYDIAAGKAVLLGDRSFPDPFVVGGFWTYDGTRWEYAGSPSGNIDPGGPLVYDAARNVHFAPRWSPYYPSVGEFTLAELNPPIITADPADAAARSGDVAVFTAEIVPDPETYVQWYFNDDPLMQQPGLDGVYSATLTVHVDFPARFGLYTLKAANPCGIVFSRHAALTPLCGRADWNFDGIVNSTDVTDFINDWFSDQSAGTLVTDFNHDGVSNSTDVSDFINAWFDAPASCR